MLAFVVPASGSADCVKIRGSRWCRCCARVRWLRWPQQPRRPTLLHSRALVWLGAWGVGVLTDVVTSALKTLRDGDKEQPLSEEAIGKLLQTRLEAALASGGPNGAALRSAVAALLQQLGATHAVVEHMTRAGEQARIAVTASLAELGEQFAEFKFLSEDLREVTWEIDASLREHRAEFRAEAERSRGQSLALTQIRELLQRNQAASLESADQAVWRGCPWLGLAWYTRRDAQVFYGRRDLTLRLCQALADRLAERGLLLVTGPSGAGKSSLLRAGLVPALSRDVLAPGSGVWPCHVLTPTSSPLRELAAHLANLAGQDPELVFASLSLDPRKAAQVAADAVRSAQSNGGTGPRLGDTGPRVVLIIDQLEELFALTGQDQAGRVEQAAFLQALETIATAPAGHEGQPPGLVVVSIRGDFLDQASVHPALARALEHATFTVGPMTEAELREVVTGPAAEARLQVEPDLVEEVVREARDRAGATTLNSAVLPLVSQALAATWKPGTDRLTLRAYRRAGGLADAVNQSAQAVYQHLENLQQAIARALFLRLTLVTADGRAGRRPGSREDIYQAARAAPGDVDPVIEAFAAKRLLVLEREKVEIAHDLLLSTWRDLQGWLGENQVDQVIYGQVLTDARTWEEHGNTPAYLYPRARIAEIDVATARWSQDPVRYAPLTDTAMAFLTAARKAARRTVLKRRAVIAGLSALTLLAAGEAIVATKDAATARSQSAIAQSQHRIALSRQFAAQALATDPADPVLARQFAVAAWAEAHTSQAAAAITSLLAEQQQQSMLIGHTDAATAVAFSPNGTLIASGGDDGTLRLWNPRTGQEVGAPIDALPDGGVISIDAVTFNPSGTIVATADANGIVRLWNPRTGREVGYLTATDSNELAWSAMAYNRSGSVLATAAGGDGMVRLWDSATWREIGSPIHAGLRDCGVNGVAFSPNSAILATATCGEVRLWDPASGHEIGKPITTDTGSYISTVAFSPNGTILVTASGDGILRLWNPATGHEIGVPITATNTSTRAVNSIAFNPSGTILATASGDGTLRLWNPATGHEIGVPITADTASISQGGRVSLNSVAFNPSGTILATAGADGTVRLWNPATGQPIGTPIAAEVIHDTTGASTVSAVAFNPSGTILATAGADIVRLWNPAVSEQTGTIIPGDGVTALAFNPSGTVLATAGTDGIVRLWDPFTSKETGTPIHADHPAPGFTGVNAVAFNPSGTILATGDGDGTVRLWATTTGKEVGTPIHSDNTQADDEPIGPNGVYKVTFCRDGTILATADVDGTVRLWSLATGKEVGTPIRVDVTWFGELAGANSRGTLLVTGTDRTIRRLSLATGQEVGTVVHAGAASFLPVAAVNEGGTILASNANSRPAGVGAAFVLSNLETGRELGIPVTATADGYVSVVAFNPSGTILATGSSTGVVQLWTTALWTDPYQTLCTEVGAPTARIWSNFAPGEPMPSICPSGTTPPEQD